MEDDLKRVICSSTNNSFPLYSANYHPSNKNAELNITNQLLDNFGAVSSNTFVTFSKHQVMISEEKSCEDFNDSLETYCHVKLDSILKLKNSTKQLLCLLEEIQAKTHTKNAILDETPKFNNILRPIQQDLSETAAIDNVALCKLRNHAKNLDAIYVEDEHDDCSIYKRLTRKCHCLNRNEYNDFIIHFNEDSKYTTSTLGEIIKNMRILRKFLYMGGIYTKHALIFLNEAMMESPHSEKVEIIQACTHADICNIFEDNSIVNFCVSWPCKYKYYGDYMTQALAANFLYKIAELEEGRRYLNYSSKITNDIRKVLRKKSTCLEIDTVQSLNATLNLLKPTFTMNVALTYFNKSVYEGVGKRTLNDLVQFRQYMTIDEVFMHLDLLNNYSSYGNGKGELMLHLPLLLILFKHILMEYDNSEINIIVTNILNNIISKKNIIRNDEPGTSKALVMTDTATEAIRMKNETSQIPTKKGKMKKINKSKCALGVSPNRYLHLLKHKGSVQEPSTKVSRSAKFNNDLKKSVILVPMEK